MWPNKGVLCRGPIPACAGEPLWRCWRQRFGWAYPRMRGGTLIDDCTVSSRPGLSPHARGNHIPAIQRPPVPGPIPACAGEPVSASIHGLDLGAYPRMRGGTHGTRAHPLVQQGLSPHARGNPEKNTRSISAQGPIPACAGEPLDHKLLIQKEISVFPFNFLKSNWT